ncbi:MBL fold metallo-hydrolase [Lysobacter sp. FW306-1B-D06B]|uniref:MBL fold metallo-hydrolase n=1 Tax=Lysobacter sp. FW306-1B-D06B TaxID=3140250 RepID=UPI0031409604
MTTPSTPARRAFRLAGRSALLLGVLIVSACLLSVAKTNVAFAGYPDSPQAADGRFRNPVPKPVDGVLKTLGLIWDVLLNKPADTVPAAALPVDGLTRAQLEAAPDRSLFRLGHSTMLIKLRGGFWITDPVFAERASPVQWAGPKRFHAPPIALEDLPPLRGVIISHDHYDHLDRETVLQLAQTTGVFLTPLGVGDRLIAWGVSPDQVRQFDWWESTTLGGVQFTATPAQHYSGRGLFDGNKTLWASWVIVDGADGDTAAHDLRLFFSGDTGYFEGFKEIGQRFGPFDVTMLETGAYNTQWPYIHMQPEQTVQAHLDLRGRWLVPMHNGTFDLAMHGWTEPFERVLALTNDRGIALATPRMGERLDLASPHAATRWWRGAGEALAFADSTLAPTAR